MYLKKDRIIATLSKSDGSESVVMRSFRLGSSKEFILDPTAVMGWTDGTAVRRDSTPRLNGHGDFGEKAKMGARLISFSGTAVASSISNLQQMRDDLVGLLANGEYGALSVETAAGTRYSTVGLEGTVSWVQQADLFATWKIDLYAPDPFIYGEWKTVQTGIVKAKRGGLGFVLSYPMNYNLIDPDTSQTIKNKGNALMWPVFKVVGDFGSGFTITDSKNSTVEYTGAVTTASPVYIDMSRGTAIQDKMDKSMLITQREWFSVAPGETIHPEFSPNTDNDQNGSGWCDILYRDTWI